MRQQLRRNPLLSCGRAFVALAALIASPAVAQAQSSVVQIRTLAGVSPAGYIDATGLNARFNGMAGVAIDSAGNAFVADTFNCAIRKVTPGGVVSTFAGSENCGNVDATGTAARFAGPVGIAIDSTDTLYVADSANTIRKITPAGVVTTLAGLAYNFGSTDGTGSAARFSNPRGIAVEAGGANIYVADSSNQTIRKVTAAGVVTTLAGLPGSPGSTDGTGSAARFRFPSALTVDGAGTLFVADTNNHTIRQVTSAGVVTTLAGTAQTPGSTDGTGSAARFSGPTGIAVDGGGTLYVADTSNLTVRQIAPGAIVTTLAGSVGVAGTADGTGSAARFFVPNGIALASGGTLFVADTGNDTLRKITAGAVVTTVAGYTGSSGSTDAAGRGARFFSPMGVAVGPGNNVFVGDGRNSTIRKITPWGQTSTFAGLAGSPGSTDGVGSAARFSFPSGLAIDSAGVMYLADTGNHTIRRIATDGTVTTVAGLAGTSGSTDGTGSAARFNLPRSVAVDGAGTLYVADGANHAIRKITAGGVVTTLAGTLGTSGYVDGTGAAARFNNPFAVAVDNAGTTIYVADSSNNSIRQVTSAGVVTTLAGNGPASGGWLDGTGTAAQFATPRGIALDGTGNLFVVDGGSNVIRKIAPGAVVTTVAGSPFKIGAEDGLVEVRVRFNFPTAIAVDSNGCVYVADTRNNTIRTSAPPRSNGGDFDNDGKSDLTIYRPGSGTWYINKSGSNYTQYVAINWGLPTDIPISGDFDGDGILDVAIFRPSTGTWWAKTSSSNYTSYISFNFGTNGDVPFAWDVDGDRIADLIIYRPSNGSWWVLFSADGYGQTGSITWGTTGDIPVPGEYAGTHGPQIAVYRPSTGEWWTLDNANGDPIRFLWGGVAGDVPVPADFDGDGFLDLAVYRPGTGEWWVLTSSSNYTSYKRYLWGGVTNDKPVPADYDGDGKADVAVYRPATGEWWVLTSSSNFTAYTRYLWGGVNGDVPVVGR
jgi:DNA-binding beta-propeller fold protein YncE